MTSANINVENETIKIDRQFLDEKKISPHLFCPICKKVFNNPVLIECGHTFCLECIKNHFKSSKKCPIKKCDFKQNQPSNYSRDLTAYNLVMELEVSCSNEGCPWTGHLSDLTSHHNLCDKVKKNMKENEKQIVKNISKRFSYDKALEHVINNDKNLTFNKTDTKEQKTFNQNIEVMLLNLQSDKKEFLNEEHVKKEDFDNSKEMQEEFKKMFS